MCGTTDYLASRKPFSFCQISRNDRRSDSRLLFLKDLSLSCRSSLILTLFFNLCSCAMIYRSYRCLIIFYGFFCSSLKRRKTKKCSTRIKIFNTSQSCISFRQKSLIFIQDWYIVIFVEYFWTIQTSAKILLYLVTSNCEFALDKEWNCFILVTPRVSILLHLTRIYIVYNLNKPQPIFLYTSIFSSIIFKKYEYIDILYTLEQSFFAYNKIFH